MKSKVTVAEDVGGVIVEVKVVVASVVVVVSDILWLLHQML